MADGIKSHRNLFKAVGVAALLGAATPGLAADAARGEAIFKTCAACHTERPNAMGPSLKGVFGRKAGAVEEFRYSNAMKHADFVWDAANLKAYITDPQAKVKGNRMPFSGLQNPGDIDDVVAYLQRLK